MFGFIAKNKLKSALKKLERKRVFLDIENIHSILILFETNEYETVDLFAEKLERMGKSISGYAFRSNKDTYDYSETNYTVINPKENLSKLGIPNDEFMKNIQSGYYDAVFDLTIKENIVLEYIATYCNAPMKIGLKKNELPLYDLAISNLPEIKAEESPVGFLSEQILLYLRTIKTKNSHEVIKLI